jgi:hypothetical protein
VPPCPVMDLTEDNIKVNLNEIVYEAVNRTYMAPGRAQWRVPVNTAMEFRVPREADNFLTS